jgi:hypothetical protein
MAVHSTVMFLLKPSHLLVLCCLLTVFAAIAGLGYAFGQSRKKR